MRWHWGRSSISLLVEIDAYFSRGLVLSERCYVLFYRVHIDLCSESSHPQCPLSLINHHWPAYQSSATSLLATTQAIIKHRSSVINEKLLIIANHINHNFPQIMPKPHKYLKIPIMNQRGLPSSTIHCSLSNMFCNELINWPWRSAELHPSLIVWLTTDQPSFFTTSTAYHHY